MNIHDAQHIPFERLRGAVAELLTENTALCSRVAELEKALEWALGIIWEEFYVDSERVADTLNEEYQKAEATLARKKLVTTKYPIIVVRGAGVA